MLHILGLPSLPQSQLHQLPPKVYKPDQVTGTRILPTRVFQHLALVDTKCIETSRITAQKVCTITKRTAILHACIELTYIGDGVTDDTAAIQAAIAAGGRCGQGCASTTTTPALVYFPAGTYMVSYPIFDYYYTQLMGDPNTMPTLKATGSFSGGYIIDGDPYFTSDQNWGSTNVFYRQIRNLQFDTTNLPASSFFSAIHWPTSQATSLQNLVFRLSAAAGTKHQGIFIENGKLKFPRHCLSEKLTVYSSRLCWLLERSSLLWRQHRCCCWESTVHDAKLDF